MDNNSQRIPPDPFVNLQVDQHFPSDDEFDSSAHHSLSIPRKKHKKSKNRHRHSDTIWTIVQEQELGNSPSGSKSKHKHSKSGGSRQPSESKRTTKNKNDKIGNKKNSTSTPSSSHSSQRRTSFLENPIFETELKNWTLPRAELWCKDPNCQINAKLLHEYCSFHQAKLTKPTPQLNELQQQQVLLRHHQHSFQIAPTVSNSSRHTCVSPPFCFNDSVDSTQHSMVLCDKVSTNGTAGIQSHNECGHQFHQPESPYYSQDNQNRCRRQSHGNMQMNMSIGAAMNNLNAQDGTTVSSAMTLGGGTYSSPSSNTNGSSHKNYTHNNTHHTPRSTPTVIITVPSGASCNTSNNSKTTSPKSVGHQQQITSSTGAHGGSEVSTRDEFNGSSSSSSSSTDVSSGSTFVTGFDSSESRTSSVPSSLSKPPLANMRIDNNHSQHRNELHSYNNKIAMQKSDHKIMYGESALATGGGCQTFVSSNHRKSSICPSCNGIVPSTTATNHHLVPVDPLSSAGDGSLQNKSDNAFWNFTKFQHPLQRDHSFHSVGGFTLNGQYNAQVKKRRVVKFCSSHKIALVVSTFSLMVTVGLIITLILMKKRGMMDTMDMMPT